MIDLSAVRSTPEKDAPTDIPKEPEAQPVSVTEYSKMCIRDRIQTVSYRYKDGICGLFLDRGRGSFEYLDFRTLDV